MVLPIGFFMPLPLAMMIPFMGIQSAVMAKQFGENFQYGKRRISAMSNEEFNKLTPKMIQDNANAELKAMIPSMEQSVQEMRVFQTFLIKEFLRTLNDAIKAGFGELFGIDASTLTNIEHTLHGHGGGHDTDTDTGAPPPPGETINLDEFDKNININIKQYELNETDLKKGWIIVWGVYGTDGIPVKHTRTFSGSGEMINDFVSMQKELIVFLDLIGAGKDYNRWAYATRKSYNNNAAKQWPKEFDQATNVVFGFNV